MLCYMAYCQIYSSGESSKAPELCARSLAKFEMLVDGFLAAANEKKDFFVHMEDLIPTDFTAKQLKCIKSGTPITAEKVWRLGADVHAAMKLFAADHQKNFKLCFSFGKRNDCNWILVPFSGQNAASTAEMFWEKFEVPRITDSIVAVAVHVSDNEKESDCDDEDQDSTPKVKKPKKTLKWNV